jgi:hypothetical protein
MTRENKNGGLGAAPAFAAALTIPFFQDNYLKNQCTAISRKIFAPTKYCSLCADCKDFSYSGLSRAPTTWSLLPEDHPARQDTETGRK